MMLNHVSQLFGTNICAMCVFMSCVCTMSLKWHALQYYECIYNTTKIEKRNEEKEKACIYM